jgi:hypothetical protein
MNSKLIIAIAVCLVVGGIFAAVHFGSGEEVTPPPINNETFYRDVPLGESFEISPGIIMDKAAAPAYFEFGSVIPGATIDTWTKNGEVRIGAERISYIPGDPLWILLYNGVDRDVTFTLQVINAPLDINHSDITKKDYSKAPDGSLVGVSLPIPLVTIQPKSCVKVPISILVPNGPAYPNQWEFRILITNLEVPGQIGTALEIRFFYTMR